MELLIDRVKFILDEHPEIEGVQGQIGLAVAAGASKSVVNQWLSGAIKSMDIKYALKIEEKLGYSHIWLMANILPIHASEKVAEKVVLAPLWMDREAFDLLNLYYRGDKDQRADIMRYGSNLIDGPQASRIAANES